MTLATARDEAALMAGNRRRNSSPWAAYRDPSLFDGSPIRAVVYCLPNGSMNRKLGPMAQVAFFNDDVPPQVAAKTGADHSVCGDCTLRPSNEGGCYVVTATYLPQVWNTSTSQPSDLEGACRALRDSSLSVRIGSWGDPASVPIDVITQLADAAKGVDGKARHTAYTSSWRTCDQRLAKVAMASVRTPEERDEAKRMGWQTYRVRAAEMPVQPGEFVCPASDEADHRSTCNRCLACSGNSTRSDVAIVAHGARWKQRRLLKVLRQSTPPPSAL